MGVLIIVYYFSRLILLGIIFFLIVLVKRNIKTITNKKNRIFIRITSIILVSVIIFMTMFPIYWLRPSILLNEDDFNNFCAADLNKNDKWNDFNCDSYWGSVYVTPYDEEDLTESKGFVSDEFKRIIQKDDNNLHLYASYAYSYRYLLFGISSVPTGSAVIWNDKYIMYIRYIYDNESVIDKLLFLLTPPQLFYKERIDLKDIANSIIVN